MVLFVAYTKNEKGRFYTVRQTICFGGRRSFAEKFEITTRIVWVFFVSIIPGAT